MANSSIRVSASMAGMTADVTVSRTEDGVIAYNPSVALAVASTGDLDTRTDDNTGVIGAAANHGIITSDKVDVYWAAGRRYNMTATVAGNNITVDGGAGDVLPAADTAVTICKQTIVDIAFDPDSMVSFLTYVPRRSSVVFVDEGGSALLALDMAAGGCALWFTDGGMTRPMTGNAVAAVWISNGDAVNTLIPKIGVVYDATP